MIQPLPWEDASLFLYPSICLSDHQLFVSQRAKMYTKRRVILVKRKDNTGLRDQHEALAQYNTSPAA